MSAIYFHIPFCKQACHYCNFHFSTSSKYKDDMLLAMESELALRKEELPTSSITSIYFGGGTPSLLSAPEVAKLIRKVKDLFPISEEVEVTLELNPDDNRAGYLEQLKEVGVNRLSIGVQSFFEEELKQMNRAHTAQEAYLLLEEVPHYFENFSLDLIYGMPASSLSSWKKNLAIALGFSPPHISSYALTVEPRTVLSHQVASHQVQLLSEEKVVDQFNELVKCLTSEGYDHYELSNFGKPDFHSVNNSSYWQGKPYLGIGPSAHSFYAQHRSWNVSNNRQYISALKTQRLPIEREKLSLVDQYNEYIMTGLRTSGGVDLNYIRQRFGSKFAHLFEKQVEKHLLSQNLYWDGDVIKSSQKALFLVDGIASDLFLLNL